MADEESVNGKTGQSRKVFGLSVIEGVHLVFHACRPRLAGTRNMTKPTDME